MSHYISPLAPKAGFPELPEIKGVRYSSAAAGVKYKNRTDVMLAELAPGSVVAGVFTRSSTRSAPVRRCEKHLAMQSNDPSTEGFAILVNSGNSNAFTGGAGEKSVDAIVTALAQGLNLPEQNIFTASTGVIGQPLPHERILDVIGDLKSRLSSHGAKGAAEAIMTTDTFPKGSAIEVDLGAPVKIAGFAKGSGMIAPDMATMLVYIFTDAKISQALLQKTLSELNETSFNAITVDGDTSTSDSLMIGATGQADMSAITDDSDPRYQGFREALSKVMLDLAHQVVKDGEGATKFVSITVKGATNDLSARKIGFSIANSPLVKTALAGEDPNWGRIVMAVGKSGEPAERDLLAIYFGDILVAQNGWVSPDYREEDGLAVFKRDHIDITVELGIGAGSSTVWSCDLTHKYIEINADYRS